MKFKYIGLTKIYRHEKLGGIKLKDGDIIEDCTIVNKNRDCFVAIVEEKDNEQLNMVEKVEKKRTRKKVKKDESEEEKIVEIEKTETEEVS